MLGNLLMDVNKPSLWKNGAVGRGEWRGCGWWWCRWGEGGAFTELLPELYEREREASHWASSGLKAYSAFLATRLTQSVLPSLSDKVQSSASSTLHHPPVPCRWPQMTRRVAASQRSCLLIISCIHNYRSTWSWQRASLHNDCAPFNLKSCQCRALQPPRDQMLYPIIDSLIICKSIKFKSSPGMRGFLGEAKW